MWEVSLVLSPGEPWSSLAPEAVRAAFLRVGAGRRLVPTAAGIVIASVVTVGAFRLPALEGERLDISPYTFAVSNQPATLGVGGILGVDFFQRFSRLSFDSTGSRRVLTLEE